MVCAMDLPAATASDMDQQKASRGRLARWVAAALAIVALFLIARHFCHRSMDFLTLHQAAKSFLAGRTDVYSPAFSWGFPQLYIYPPFFLFLLFPLGWLSFANAYGVWIAGQALATGILIVLAYREWRPRRAAPYWVVLVALAAAPVIYALRTGNAHLIVILITLAGILAWSRERTWAASICLALGGVIKLFPLFLLPFILVRREWKLALKIMAFSCLFWAAPLVYFGPRQTVSLYWEWYQRIPVDVPRFETEHQLDYSLSGAARRWLSHVDYSQYRDKEHPEVNWLDLPSAAVRGISRILNALVWGLALLLAYRLPKAGGQEPESRAARHRLGVATIASLYVTSQLLTGPYTIFLYLSGWLIVGLTLPVVLQRCAERLNYGVLAIGVANLAALAVPGRSHHRAIEAYGVFTALNLGLWLITLIGAWKLLRTFKLPAARARE